MSLRQNALLRKVCIGFIGAAVLTLIPGILNNAGVLPNFIAINRTPSIPVGIYATSRLPADKLSAVDYGEITCFRYRVPDWAQGRAYFRAGGHLCKYLVAKEGDTLKRDASGLWLAIGGDGVTRAVGFVAETDSSGRPLPQNMLSEGVVPAGKVVIASANLDKSLDSRYLGLISLQDLTMKKRPLLTFE